VPKCEKFGDFTRSVTMAGSTLCIYIVIPYVIYVTMAGSTCVPSLLKMSPREGKEGGGRCRSANCAL